MLIPPSLSDIVFTSEISNIVTFYRSAHDNILLMGNFNMTPNNPKLSELIADHELCTLMSGPTCFNPTYIDNFLTNKKTRFMKTLTFEMGVSDHHKLIGTMLRSTFAKGKPTVAIENLTIKSLKENYKNNYPQCQVLNHFNLHLKSF